MSDLNSDFIDYIEFGGNYLHQNKQNEAKFRLDEFDPNTAIPTLIEMGYDPDIINGVWDQGNDTGQYPSTRQVTLGLQVTF